MVVLVGVLSGLAAYCALWPAVRSRLWGSGWRWRPRRAPGSGEAEGWVARVFGVAAAEQLCREAGRPYGLSGHGLLALQWGLGSISAVMGWGPLGPAGAALAAALGWWAPRLAVKAARDARHATMAIELPGILDLWALLVAGGDSIESALVEITRRHPHWLVSGEMRRVLERVAASGLLAESLVTVARENGAPAMIAVAEQVRQFVDGGGAPARELARMAAVFREERVSQLRRGAAAAAVAGVLPKVASVFLGLAPVFAHIVITMARVL